MRAAVPLLLLALLAPPLHAQDALPGPASAPAPASVPAPTGEGLVASTLAGDIQSASYYELVAWCRQLGLDESGARKDLQARLAGHFRVTLPEAKGKAGRRITVRSARDSQYFTVTEVNQKYVVMRGDVVVEITDGDSASLQRIKTQSLTYNQTRGTVTATGGVEYSITQNDKTETFRGESLTFNVNSGEGDFYDGRTSRPQKRGGKDITFSFGGETISRLQNDTVIMDNGSITSDEDDTDPHWQMRATRVWILAPGEWAAQNAVLSVGRVPVLYLPVFFFPGDEIFFNPAFGYDVRKGAYLQTTTYLIGKKKPQDSGFSFLQLAQGDEGSYDQELRGIFLRKIPARKDKPKDTGATLKVLADGYSRLGALAGIAGEFPQVASFRVGVAASRSIFGDSASGYSPYLILGDGTNTQSWNSSSLFGFSLPFRFGMDGSLKASADFGSLSAAFEYYSDPFFTQDFYSRTEGIQLTPNLNALLTQNQAVAIKSNLSWDLTARADFSKAVNSSLLQSVTVPNLNLRLSWLNKQDPFASAADPGRMFYYPSSLVAPSASVSLSGELLRFGSSASPAKPPPAPPAATPGGAGGAGGAAIRSADLRPPAPLGVTERQLSVPSSGQAAAAAPVRFLFHTPTRRADANVTLQAPQSSGSLTYQVQPRVNLEQTFDPTNWQSQKDVDLSLLYGTFETGGSSRIAGNVSFMDKTVDTSLALAADGGYRLRYFPGAAPDYVKWTSLLKSDLAQDQFALRALLQTSVRPLAAMPALSNSSISYRVNERLYQARLLGSDPFNPVATILGPGWDTESVTEHSLQGILAVAALGKTDTLSVTAQLPPLAASVTAQLDLAAWFLRAHVQGGAAQNSGILPSTAIQPMVVWVPQPLVASTSFDPVKDVSLSQEVQFDLTASTLSRATSQLRLWGLSSSFSAQTLIPTNGLGNPTGAAQGLYPSTFRMAYDSSGSSLYLWENRIKLDSSVKSAWTVNLQKYTDNALDFSLAFTLSIFRFLDLSFTSTSSNTKTYLYFPAWASAIGETPVDPLSDLLRSFNFFNINDRYASSFKLKTISFKAIHHLHDWDLTFEYQGSPQLKTYPDGRRQYEWSPVFALRLQWNAIPELQATTSGDSTGLNLRGATATTQATTP